MGKISLCVACVYCGLFLAACGNSSTNPRDATASPIGGDASATTGGAGGTVTPHPDGAAGQGGGPSDASVGAESRRDATDTSVAGAGGKGTGGAGGGPRTGGAGGSGVDGGNAGGAGGGAIDGGCGPSPGAPAVSRGGKYFGFDEKLNRYYTDCAWQPASTVYVSPSGTGNGSSRTNAASVPSALAAATPGRMIVFTAGTYSGCYELDGDHSGTYDSPIVLFGERKADGSPAVVINCCGSGRKTCINLESANYVAVDGFELSGGDYGVRSVGPGYAANEHQKGVAILNSVGHGQNKDPFFSGQSDWLVIERCTGYDSGSGDGHGIYLSNGSDWNIARWNETYNTYSSDFQINADPLSTCDDEGVAFTDPECDAVAGSHPTGGRGASDFMLIEGNFFHHSKAQGPNFTSVRNSTIKNNIFALPARHGTSFWQETDNPKLGSSNNLVAHNLFVTQTANRQAIGVLNESTDNQFKNNVIVAVSISGTTVSANTSGQLLATDGTTVKANTFEHNVWISGFFGSEDAADPYVLAANELRLTTFDATWFAAFPTALARDPGGFAPSAKAPWLDQGSLLSEVLLDRDGAARRSPTDLGPYER